MDPIVTIDGRRQALVRHLYGLHQALGSGNPQRSAEARRTLARLRRAFAGRQQEAEAYDVVFPHDPPVEEQELWLLVAGLFALHPHADNARRRSIGGAMRLLVADRPSAARRFTQLLSVDPAAMPHYLRQTIQLLRSDGISVDYQLLLADLVKMHSSREEAHRVRLRWARDYHRPNRQPTSQNTETTEPELTEEADVEPVDA
ncbi:type I-E CRISPR-associated protein Cse2/CasB [Micromonospora sp. NBC_01796]|uniref:type I-E CRISPR-associated protein Cse2/CasB n=1 Tax=Micromonospora sp. NBC_01796 TaxID=2975987 RepID=UPI002DDBD438|nr:type I-E CRISPR-associated protein Cse2/CasB [Micromonospora sp. NBC_01796]WSA83822.1 type I-E CRISPR-associated protein Cse2/CasB [Micromonospora sp. NBC_01796]